MKDKALNQLYRGRYSTCYRKYALTVPFIERFLELTKQKNSSEVSSGYVGVIVSNSFMTERVRQDDSIEEHLSQFDLTHVIDTSGAYIPGHGTPTLIALLRARISTSRAGSSSNGHQGRAVHASSSIETAMCGPQFCGNSIHRVPRVSG